MDSIVHLIIIEQHATSMWHKTNPKNTEFVLLCSLMFGIDSFGSLLQLIDDWPLAMQVNIRQSFFRQSFAAAFSPNFLLPKFFTIRQ